jgi:hypothetical protein
VRSGPSVCPYISENSEQISVKSDIAGLRQKKSRNNLIGIQIEHFLKNGFRSIIQKDSVNCVKCSIYNYDYNNSLKNISVWLIFNKVQGKCNV